MLINEIKLNLPIFKLKDWETAAESASGAMQDILVALTDGVRLLATIQPPMDSTERMGWLNAVVKGVCGPGGGCGNKEMAERPHICS